METILCPLTSIDVSGVERIVLTLGSLLSTPADSVKIEQALSRVTLKWRLLAGRVEWDSAAARYAVRVPLGAILPSYATYGFTSTSSAFLAPFPIPNLTPKSAGLNPPPPRAHFRARETPASIDQFAKEKAPLVQVRVETWENCQTVGITVPHGVLDGIGLGMVIKALEAELKGEEWTAPALSESNLLAETLERAVATCDVAVDVEEDERRRVASGSAKSVVDMARLVWSLAKERFWYGCTPGEVFVGREVMERIVRGVKEEVRVQTEGKEWVSTGDVLVAWTMKTLYSGEPLNDNSLSTAICYNIRPIISPSTPEDLASYPHKALALLFIDPIAVSSLPSTPLGTLALSHRRSLTAHLTLPHLLANLEYSNTHFPIPARRRGTDGLNITNQVQSGLTGTKWGAPKGSLAAWWEWGIEEVMDHTGAWNETEAGWVLTISMRAARWKAVEAVLEQLERDEATLEIN